MRNLISLEEVVKVRSAAPAVGSGCAAHYTLWCEMQTSLKTGVLKNYSWDVRENGFDLYFLNGNYLFTNYLSNLIYEPDSMHNQVNIKRIY